MLEDKYEQRTFEGDSSSSTGDLLKFHEGTSQPRPTWRRRIRSKPRLITAICVATVFLALGLALGLGLGLGLHHQRALPGMVDLGYSKYQGRAVGGGISQWLGIRYAAPPVGDLRFAAPRSPSINDTIQQADQVRQKMRRSRVPSSNIGNAARPSMPRDPRVRGYW